MALEHLPQTLGVDVRCWRPNTGQCVHGLCGVGAGCAARADLGNGHMRVGVLVVDGRKLVVVCERQHGECRPLGRCMHQPCGVAVACQHVVGDPIRSTRPGSVPGSGRRRRTSAAACSTCAPGCRASTAAHCARTAAHCAGLAWQPSATQICPARRHLRHGTQQRVCGRR